ncbi:MAG: acyltransferase domain-containing protein [Microlunatus sp.]
MLDVRERLSAPDLSDRLMLLGFRDDDRADTLAAATSVLGRADLLAVVQRTAERLLPEIGCFRTPGTGAVPSPWREDGTDSSYGVGVLELLALLASVDDVRAFHASRGIAPDDSWRALSDLGQQVFVHRLTYGSFGLHTHDWLRVVWSGALYWLGRLQFNLQPSTVGVTGWELSTHIPRSGPLSAEEVDASFACARRFFAKHFDDHPADAFFCSSWLLDPELCRVLPESSNMVKFQQRWALDGEPAIGDNDALFFTFSRRPPVDLDALPRDTTLQRAIIDRIRAGNHWQVWGGRIPFADLPDNCLEGAADDD